MGTLARELALRYSKTMTLNDYVDFETLEEWILKELELMRQRGETTNKGSWKYDRDDEGICADR